MICVSLEIPGVRFNFSFTEISGKSILGTNQRMFYRYIFYSKDVVDRKFHYCYKYFSYHSNLNHHLKEKTYV